MAKSLPLTPLLEPSVSDGLRAQSSRSSLAGVGTDHPAISVPSVRHILPLWLGILFTGLLSYSLFGSRSIDDILASALSGDKIAIFGLVALSSSIILSGLLGCVTSSTIAGRSEREARRFFFVFSVCQMAILLLTCIVLARAATPPHEGASPLSPELSAESSGTALVDKSSTL